MKLKIDFFPILMALIIILIFGFKSSGPVSSPNKDLSLQFNKNREFKIAQFTDTHYNTGDPEECSKTKEILRHVLEKEQPDLVVLTGDIVTDSAEAGWKNLMSVFTEAGVNFSVTLGNHDDEAEWSRTQIFDYLESLPGFMGEKGPGNITGVGNYVISLKTAGTENPISLLWFFDSNAYCEDKTISDYDWIKFDQIYWYRQKSQQYTLHNKGNPLPALAFFHIPLPEYNEIIGQPATLGENQEEVCSPKINTGMFAAFVEMKDVMGTFVGHDHVNNYIGVYKGIALAYGQSTGGYGELRKGARIIVLQENKHNFDTWIRTPDGRKLHYTYSK